MPTVSLVRLYILRATYLLIAVGLGCVIWPGILSHTADWPHNRGVVHALLGAVGALAVLGLRYPLQMLPLLVFELVWKVIWLVAFAWPLARAGQMTPATSESVRACLMGVIIVPLALPWRYLFDHYVRAAGDRWR